MELWKLNEVMDLSVSSLQDVVKGLQSRLSSETFTMVVRRDHVLCDALKRMSRKNFSPMKSIKVIIQSLSHS